MPKAEQILANLPPTFRAVGLPSALRAVSDAYGQVLQEAENALAALMRAHWVEFADAGRPAVLDLGRIAAMYGLAPRPDETVEEFRDHLLRHVQAMLAGSVTVRGVLDVAAAAVGLHLADDLDAWWEPTAPADIVLDEADGADAAPLVLGVASVMERGVAAAPAAITGVVDLRSGVDVRATPLLRIAIDGGGAVAVDLAAAAADPRIATGDEIVAAVDAALGAGTAAIVDGLLQLRSSTHGPSAEVVVAEGPQDAAEVVLGLPARSRRGSDATAAMLRGAVDLSTPLDLRDDRYLRIAVDGSLVIEVDCAATAADPAAVDIADITAAVNAAAEFPLASDDGRTLTLTSRTTGAGSVVALRPPAAQAATARLFGDVALTAFGEPAARASMRGVPLGFGADLSDGDRLRLAVDDRPAVAVALAGADPAATTPAEIIAAVNTGLGDTIAAPAGDRVVLASPLPGEGGVLTVEEGPGDAAATILGLRPRTAAGAPPTRAAVTGTPDLAAGVDLSARHLLRLGVDGLAAVDVDLRRGAADPHSVTLDEIVDAINAAVSEAAAAAGGPPPADPVATHDGAHLILVSPSGGPAGRLAVDALRKTSTRRFVTSTLVTDDAAVRVLGVAAAAAVGEPGGPAVIAGTADLSAGVDLTRAHRLRLVVDDAPAVEIDLGGDRLRAVTAEQVAQRINTAMSAALGIAPAATDGRRVTLRSPASGAGSRLAVEAPQALDAVSAVLGRLSGSARGEAATGVTLVGTRDLSAGIDLAPDAAIRVARDGGPALDVPLGDAASAGPARRSLTQLVLACNRVLGPGAASHDGRSLVLSTAATGAAARLVLEPPVSGSDATASVLGVTVPRDYRGRDAVPAVVIGTADLTGGIDATEASLMRVAVDGDDPVIVDVAAGAADRSAVSPAEIAGAVNAATRAVATTSALPGGAGLRIASPTVGPGSRIEVGPSGAGDAAPLVFGPVPLIATGTAPAPATIEGTVDVTAGVELSGATVLRISVDSAPPVDVDISGAAPTVSFGAEMVAAINEALPGTASLSETGMLRLVSGTPGAVGRVDVLPLRRLVLQEYPPQREDTESAVVHGGRIAVNNRGAAAAAGSVTVVPDGGISGPGISDPAAGWAIQVDDVVPPGHGLLVRAGADPGDPPVIATVTGPSGDRHVPPARVHVRSGGGVPLTVPRGHRSWLLTEVDAARLDSARFDRARFAAGRGGQVAVLDVSRFDGDPETGVIPVLAGEPSSHPVTVRVTWDSHVAGAFEVVLPAALDRRFGAVLGDLAGPASGPVLRLGAGTPERYEGVVAEPEGDPDHIATRVNRRRSGLIEAAVVDRVPIGWTAVPVPFRAPRPLTGGRAGQSARIYLSEPGLAPRFIVLTAAEAGEWGNDVTVSCRGAAPAVYDLEVGLAGGRFENARAVVSAALAPAAAAGVRIGVSRSGVPDIP